MDDKKLVSQLLNGNAIAFEDLFNRYSKKLYYFAYGYLKSKSDSEEVVQDIFLKIWHNRENLDPEQSFNGYLFKIAYRQIAEKFRKVILEKKYIHDIAGESIDFTDELNERTNYQSLLELVEKQIDILPARQKEVLLMRKFQGYQVAEIAEKQSISVKTVEHHITEALKTIRNKLGKENIGGILFFILFVKSSVSPPRHSLCSRHFPFSTGQALLEGGEISC